MTTTDQKTERERRVSQLRRQRPKSWLIRWSCAVLAGLTAWAWLGGGNLLGRLSAERRWINFKNFASDLVPSPVRESGDWLDFFPWAWRLLAEGGLTALLMTLGIACAAIIFAAAATLPFLPIASRKLGCPEPLGVRQGRLAAWSKPMWRAASGGTRFLFVLARAVPEYILAFLLISLLGLNAWPLVLALAIHNFGILGRLWGEVVENADPAAAEFQAAAGSGRMKVFFTVLLPALFNRFLIYFFYRWETCTKDAAVLGMLGLLTLGHLIALSKGFFWDEMFFYIMLGSSVILAGDFLSTWLRKRLRNS
ncbi:MAG: phosphonate transport system permease protein [Verrucomicrobiales bacterium]|jgi:phosphonate transport system permease protein